MSVLTPRYLLIMLTLTLAMILTMWTAACGSLLTYRPWTSVQEAQMSGDLDCDLPPSVWCSSREIAQRCQVEQQCEQNVWGSGRRDPPVPVRLGVYIESLCPDCKAFINHVLWPAWKELYRIMNLELIPYGNAKEKKAGDRWAFTCQHGPDECAGNLIESCAIHILKNATVYFPYVNCIEESDVLPVKVAPKCAKQLGINYKPIEACSKSSKGNELEHQMAQKTNNLIPPHTFVPWITLNGVHTDEIQEQAINNLVKLICDTYKGTKPPACEKQLNIHHKDSW